MPATSDTRGGHSLPPELRDQATRRIRLVALIYALAFFLADVLPELIAGELAMRLSHPLLHWVPTFFSIAAGLILAAVVSSPRLSWDAKVNLGLVFQVIGSYGIALAMYIMLPALGRTVDDVAPATSPSWVAIWMIFYSIVVPAPPGRALLALVASATAQPLVTLVVLGQAGIPLGAFHILIGLILPQLICGAMAWIGARTVYTLGTDVTRARELGSYRLVERLGHGGMGEVWRATHQMLAREAAIKFIHPQSFAGASQEGARSLLKRFELEARATASLTSAHTIDVYDYGVTEDGTFYYVMELLEGLDCDDLVRRYGPLPSARAVHLLKQVCESLEEAHAKGLIHRDVKPANVYVCRSGARRDFVKVLDFGLVAEHRAVTDESRRLTMPEQAVGTPHSMPPEMALGRPIDTRADLYGIGCVAYFLTTARPVFDGETYYEIVSKHMHAVPEPPSRHAPEGIPPELEALILACLEKDPDRRPSGARELRHRLEAVPLADPWDDDRAEAWWASRAGSGAEHPPSLAPVH